MGAAIARGSQKCSGTCALLASAATAISAPATVVVVGLGALEQLGQRERAVLVVEQHRPDQQRHRADAGHQQRHQRRAARLAPVAVEADQEVRRDRGQVEEDEQQDEVARAREPDHRHHEQTIQAQKRRPSLAGRPSCSRCSGR